MNEDEKAIINSILKDYNVYYDSIKELNRSLYDFDLMNDYKESLKHMEKHFDKINPCCYDYFCDGQGNIICELKSKMYELIHDEEIEEFKERARKEAEKPKEEFKTTVICKTLLKCSEDHGKIIFVNDKDVK